MGREEYVCLLLERGWDPNGDAPLHHNDAILFPVEKYVERWIPRRSRTPLSGSVLLLARNNNDGFSDERTRRTLLIDHCTPLAAAIACGQEECARLLWDYPGVRRLEEPSVSRAVASCLNPVTKNWDGSFSIYSRNFFLPGLLSGADSVHTFCDDMVPLLLDKDMKPSTFADLCPPELLALMYDKGICGAEEARRVVQTLDPGNPRWNGFDKSELHFDEEPSPLAAFFSGPGDSDQPMLAFRRRSADAHRQIRQMAELILLTEERFPDLFAEPWAAGVLLRYCVLVFQENKASSSPMDDDLIIDPVLERMAALWRGLGGGDLTWAARDLWRLSSVAFDRLMTLCKGIDLAIDSCADGNAAWPEQLRVLLSRVSVRPVRAPEGQIGALSAAVLRTGVPEIRRMARSGALNGENPALLYELLPKNALSLRPAILTLAPGDALPLEQLEPGKVFTLAGTELEPETEVPFFCR